MTTTAFDDRAAIAAAARDFAETVLAPGAMSRDAEKHFPVDLLVQAGELGLGGIYVREESGGSGLSRRDAVVIFEELARADTTIAAYISIHNMVAWMVDAYGSAEQHARWLPGLSEMTELGSYCLTEPGAGSDAAALRTTARRDGDWYVLDGVKQFISGAGTSAVYVVLARTGPVGANGISAFLVPAGVEGMSFGPEEHKMGWRAQPTRQVLLDAVRVPADGLLGAEGQGFSIAMRGLNGGRLNIAACSLGGAQWAFERTVDHVAQRETFGRKLAEHQSVLFTLADMETELRAARGLLYSAAESLDEGRDDAAIDCAVAKRYATDVAFTVVNSALQLHGGYGYLSEYGIERVLRDLRLHQIVEGANEIMKVIIGRHVLRAGR